MSTYLDATDDSLRMVSDDLAHKIAQACLRGQRPLDSHVLDYVQVNDELKRRDDEFRAWLRAQDVNPSPSMKCSPVDAEEGTSDYGFLSDDWSTDDGLLPEGQYRNVRAAVAAKRR